MEPKTQPVWRVGSPPEFTVRICVSGYRSHINDETVYYRYKVPFDQVVRFRWYFEWITALIKATHPHRKVTLDILKRDENSVKCGDDYIREALPNKIKGLRAKITAEKNRAMRGEDLFGFAAQRAAERIRSYEERLARYEEGEVDFWVPPTYINKIRDWFGREDEEHRGTQTVPNQHKAKST